MLSEIISRIDTSSPIMWAVWAIGLHITNTALGIYMALLGRREWAKTVHRTLFLSIVVCLLGFIISYYFKGRVGIMDYLVTIYFIVAIPASKRQPPMIHAFVATVGLTLLPMLILLKIL
jgi:lysylphosphatidylglycerol synthetase-like protein (DUF2156 family)